MRWMLNFWMLVFLAQISVGFAVSDPICLLIQQRLVYFDVPHSSPRPDSLVPAELIANPWIMNALASEFAHAAGENMISKVNKESMTVTQRGKLPEELRRYFDLAKTRNIKATALDVYEVARETIRQELDSMIPAGERTVSESLVLNSSLPKMVKVAVTQFLNGGGLRAFDRALTEPFPFDRVEQELFFDRFIPHARKIIVDTLMQRFVGSDAFGKVLKELRKGPLRLRDGTEVRIAEKPAFGFESYRINESPYSGFISIEKGAKKTVVGFIEGNERKSISIGTGYLLSVREYEPGLNEVRSGFDYSEKTLLESLTYGSGEKESPREKIEARLQRQNPPIGGMFDFAKVVDGVLREGRNTDELLELEKAHHRQEVRLAAEYLSRKGYLKTFQDIWARAKKERKTIDIGDYDFKVTLAPKVVGFDYLNTPEKKKVAVKGPLMILTNRGYEELRTVVNTLALKQGRLEIDFYFSKNRYAGKLILDENGQLIEAPDVEILRHMSFNTEVIKSDLFNVPGPVDEQD